MIPPLIICFLFYLFVCLWEQAPEGIQCICKRFPLLKIVTSEIDYGLNEELRVIPGLGEYGERYFGKDDGSCHSMAV
jgi:uracil phosphoribosyltransferase